MKYISIFLLSFQSGCALMPFVVEEAEKAVEFEVDAVKREIEFREAHPEENK